MTQYTMTQIVDTNDKDDEDTPEILQDGQAVRVPMMMRDGLDDTQKAIATFSAQLSDGLGNQAGCRPGYVISDAIDHYRRAEQRDFAKAELSAAYKGGLETGDRLQLVDRAMIVTGHNAENGKVRLSEVEDAEDAELARVAAYDSYEHHLTSAWQKDEDLGEGDSCIVDGKAGRICREGGQLVCRPLRAPARRAEAGSEKPDDHEWAIAGPLSDGGQNVKDAAYAQYEQNLRDAWRR